MVYPNSSSTGDRIYCELKNCTRELDILQGDVLYFNTNGNNLTGPHFNSEEYVKLYLGERQINYVTVCLLTFIYVTILLSGLIGNIFTVLVILKNVYMRSVTNYYLLSLSTADLLTIVFGKSSLLIKNFVKRLETARLTFFVVFVFQLFFMFCFRMLLIENFRKALWNCILNV